MEENKSMVSTIMMVLLIGIILIVGIYILTQMQTTFRAQNTAGSVVNESVANPMGGSSHLAAVNLIDGSCGAITQILNGTNGVNIALANFTQSGCSFNNVTSMQIYGSTLLVSYPYTYSADTASSNASGSSVTALGNGTPWLTIIIVVAFAVITLGFLTKGFNKSELAEQQLTY